MTIHSPFRTAGLGYQAWEWCRHRLVQEIAGSVPDPHVAGLHALLPRQQGGIPRRVQGRETEVLETALGYWRLGTVRFGNRRDRGPIRLLDGWAVSDSYPDLMRNKRTDARSDLLALAVPRSCL
jgi:hypothetical protein